MEITILLKRRKRVGGYSQYCKRPKKNRFFLLWRLPKLLASIPPWREGEGLLDNVQIFIVFFMAYLRIKIILKNQQRPFDCLANPFKDFPLSLYVYAEGGSLCFSHQISCLHEICSTGVLAWTFHVSMNLFILIIFHIELCEIIFDYEINNSCIHEIHARNHPLHKISCKHEIWWLKHPLPMK